MAAVVWQPGASETGLPSDGLHVVASPWDGAGALNAVQWQVAETADTGYASPVYDSGLRSPNARWLGPQAADLPVVLPAGTYRVRVRRRGTSLEAYSASAVFTVVGNGQTGTTWAECQ